MPPSTPDPAGPKTGAQAVVDAGTSAAFATLTVLLVEPSAIQARIIREQLAGMQVSCAAVVGTGAAALKQLHQNPRLLTVSTFYLPDMSGVELIQSMRADPALADSPFVLISSETRPQVLDPIRQSGVCAVLPKPFTSAQLAAALRAAADILDPNEMLDIDGDVSRLRVLLVDDSANARRFIRHILRNLGIENFIEAANGNEAVSILAETRVDLLITDYYMPEMDGCALTQHVRQQSWQSDVPILMVTSEADKSRLDAVKQAGVSAICSKPFETQTIKLLVEQLLAQ